MAVRGAPALGVAAGLAVALWAQNETQEIEDSSQFHGDLAEVLALIESTRPTAVNLHWGTARMRKLAGENMGAPIEELRRLLVDEAMKMLSEDEQRNRVLGENGAKLIKEGSRVLTHCNAGSLATVYYGTALGVVYAAYEQGKIEHVWVDETRPVLQGARLTMWELAMAGIPAALIADNMAAALMKADAVDAVIVGADRIAANGDVANKIGTYGLAVLAHEHDIPFYVAAPSSTVDLTISTGDEIVIEHRRPEELAGFTWSGVVEEPDEATAKALDSLLEDGTYQFDIALGHKLELQRKGDGFQLDGWARTTPDGISIFNPAFDVTPAKYITAIVTERGIAEPDFEMSLAVLMMGAGGYHEVTVE
jgi:methylthioribose-1-phosphate isomerase